MGKIVKIEKGDCGLPAQLLPFGSVVVRFTFDSGDQVCTMADAFPSEEVMIKDATAAKGFIPTVLAEAIGKPGTEAMLATAVTEWTPLYVDRTPSLKLVK